MASLTQPQSQKVYPGKTPFGGAPVDANRVAMFTDGSWFQTQDATPTTALVSPLTVLTSAVTTLIIPANATYVTILPTTNAVQVSEASGTTSLSQYFTVPAGTPMTFYIARQNNIYLLAVTGSSVVSFFFTTV